MAHHIHRLGDRTDQDKLPQFRLVGDCIYSRRHNLRVHRSRIRLDPYIPSSCKLPRCTSFRNKTLSKHQMVAFLAVGLTYTTAIVNELVYKPEGAKEAAGAGFILLSMVMVRAPSLHRSDLPVDNT